MAEESFFYTVTVSISEAALKEALAEVVVKFVALSGKETSDAKPLQPLHRELLYALIGAGEAKNAKLRTAYWYVKFERDDHYDYYYFTDVVLRAVGKGFRAMLPAAYLLDKDGAATVPYLRNLRQIDMEYTWASAAGRILQDLTLTKKNDTWMLVADASLSRHVLGEFAGVLPCPGPWSWSKDVEWHKEERPLAERGHRLVVGAWNADASGYRLCLTSVTAVDGLVKKGSNLVIVALVGTDLHIRIFDASGKKVDKAENELVSGETLTALKKQLTPIPDESGLSKECKQKIIEDATLLAGHAHVTRPSESLLESLTALTSMLRSPKSHVTLIMGEPGAGKEIFSDAMHFGSVMGWNKAWRTRQTIRKSIVVKGGKEARSIAGIALEEFNERLFTVVKSSPSIRHAALTRWWREVCMGAMCLIEEAEDGGTIFLDEFDKPAQSREIYSALLRVLEAKEYIRRTVHGDRIVTSPARYKNVSWVMAGAFFQVDPRESIPRDLWSRMTGLLNLKNPVAGDCDYGATLFMYAYLTEVGATLAADKSKPEEGITKLLEAVSKFSTGITFRESVALRILGIEPTTVAKVRKVFHPQAGLRTLADDFAKHLRVHTMFVGDATDTPRGIMKAADAAFRVVRDRCIAKPDLFLGSSGPDGLEAAKSARVAAHDALVLSRGPS